MAKPVASVVVPTRDRAGYLAVTLASLADQDFVEPYEVIVVDDGSRDPTPAVLERAGVRSIAQDPPRGPNAARNAGTRASEAELIALVDDDVFAPRGWLRALVEGARRQPDFDVFGGPIRARLEGPAPRSCGREQPPVTTLDLGPDDRETELVWSANMLFRRSAFDRVGPFDESRPPGGDEEEWLRRLSSVGGRVFYVAQAAIDHRRAGDDARLRSLMRSAYHRGCNLRAYDESRGVAPGLGHELRVFAGCGWHLVRRACPQGLIMGAHSAGRLMSAVSPGVTPRQTGDTRTGGAGAGSAGVHRDLFLSGEHGHVAGRLRRPVRIAGDRALDLWLAASGARRALAALGERTPRRDVLIASALGSGSGPVDIGESRHALRIAAGARGGGKFQNLNSLLAGQAPADWLLVVDDDVELPRGFIDAFVALCERLAFDLAQPAQTLASHAAWRFARRRAFSVARETNFVEIGPVTAFSRRAAEALLPFPDLRYGWGLDAHWAALAAERGWRLGIVDALPVRHEVRPVAAGYASDDAVEEARVFLADKPYVPARDAGRTLRVHRRVPS